MNRRTSLEAVRLGVPVDRGAHHAAGADRAELVRVAHHHQPRARRVGRGLQPVQRAGVGHRGLVDEQDVGRRQPPPVVLGRPAAAGETGLRGEERGDVRGVRDAVVGQDVGRGLGDRHPDRSSGLGAGRLGAGCGEVAPGEVERCGGVGLAGAGGADEDGGRGVRGREPDERGPLGRVERGAHRVRVEPGLDLGGVERRPASDAGGTQHRHLRGQVAAGGVLDLRRVDRRGGPVAEPGGRRGGADLAAGDLDDVLVRQGAVGELLEQGAGLTGLEAAEVGRQREVELADQVVPGERRLAVRAVAGLERLDDDGLGREPVVGRLELGEPAVRCGLDDRGERRGHRGQAAGDRGRGQGVPALVLLLDVLALVGLRAAGGHRAAALDDGALGAGRGAAVLVLEGSQPALGLGGDGAAAAGEQVLDVALDADDPASDAVLAHLPAHTEPAGQLALELALGHRGDRRPCAVQRLAVERTPLPVVPLDLDEDRLVDVQLRVVVAGGVLEEPRHGEGVDVLPLAGAAAAVAAGAGVRRAPLDVVEADGGRRHDGVLDLGGRPLPARGASRRRRPRGRRTRRGRTRCAGR